jgi:predicted amino acid racemase
MFLERTRKRNPELIKVATQLHQAGDIPPNTYVFDADAFTKNGQALRQEAQAHNLKLYFMTKQHGRNPELFRRIIKPGAKETVSVNMECARILHKHGIGLGHIGNLVQTPRAELRKIIGTYRPEVITVFSVEKAQQISEAAISFGIKQSILLRVHSKQDILFPGMEGGFYIDELSEAARMIRKLPGVVIAGVSTFPALAYNKDGAEPVATPNLRALIDGRDLLDGLGIQIWQINAPGNTACNTMSYLAQNGVTHVEPGSALTAHSTFHLYQDDLLEQPAMVYVTEISHKWDNQIYVYGGGFFVDDPPVSLRDNFVRKALVGNTPEKVLEQELIWKGIGARGGGSFAAIDYHGLLENQGHPCSIGDTVVFGFRTQMFMTRAYSAVVEGLSSHTPRLVGIWDWAGHRVGGGIE